MAIGGDADETGPQQPGRLRPCHAQRRQGHGTITRAVKTAQLRVEEFLAFRLLMFMRYVNQHILAGQFRETGSQVFKQVSHISSLVRESNMCQV